MTSCLKSNLVTIIYSTWQGALLYVIYVMWIVGLWLYILGGQVWGYGMATNMYKLAELVKAASTA